MKILPSLYPIPYTLNSKCGFTLIELLVARHPKLQRRKATLGFTLIELLVVIGVLTVLLAIVLIAINPARQFSQANNTQRRSDVNALLNAVHQYAADNKGSMPAAITTTATVIGSAAGQVNLCASVVPTYLADLPLDPSTGTETPANSLCTAATSYNTGYTIVRSTTNNRVTVAAPSAELSETISVTR